MPGKNLRRVNGRSLLRRAVEAAKGANWISRTFVSTDDARIADAASELGALVIARPTELASDAASSESALLHALQDASERFGHLPDILVFIQCTSPFLRSADIDGMVTLLQEQRGDCALTACRFHGFVWRSPLHASGINHDLKVRVRRQDAMPEFLETGSAYAMQVEGFLAARHRFFGRPLLYEVPRSRSLEVDTLDDLKLARIMARNLEGRRTP